MQMWEINLYQEHIITIASFSFSISLPLVGTSVLIPLEEFKRSVSIPRKSLEVSETISSVRVVLFDL